MASPEHNSSQPAVSSSVVAGGASPTTEGQSTGTEPSATASDSAIARGSKRKLTSAVWDEFTKDEVKQQAQCMYCKKWLSAGSKSGTNHLASHLKSCAAKCAPVGLKQQKLKLSQNVDGSVDFGNNDGVFDAVLARKDLALMICVHEYPLSIVEHTLFRKFCTTLQPLFKMVCRNTIRKDILEMHAAQKESLVRYFANFKYRVAITSDMWTAGHQKKGYMVVTAHFIDESWNLKSFLLRFAYVPCPHNGEVICQALYECLVDWHLEGKARGLDVLPTTIARFRAGGDEQTAKLLEDIIYPEEVTHCAAGVRWFRYLCLRSCTSDPIAHPIPESKPQCSELPEGGTGDDGHDGSTDKPAVNSHDETVQRVDDELAKCRLCEKGDGDEVAIIKRFHSIVREHFRGPLKPPFNTEARKAAGFEPAWYEPLAVKEVETQTIEPSEV